ncbi:MAG: GIY-YIG nuclease family protein, partial [Candidatus Microgenomates bacterium]
MSWFTYIVECRDKSFYTGITWNLKKRISEHNSRVQSCLQISKVPVKLVYWEKFNDRFEAA